MPATGLLQLADPFSLNKQLSAVPISRRRTWQLQGRPSDRWDLYIVAQCCGSVYWISRGCAYWAPAPSPMRYVNARSAVDRSGCRARAVVSSTCGRAEGAPTCPSWDQAQAHSVVLSNLVSIRAVLSPGEHDKNGWNFPYGFALHCCKRASIAAVHQALATSCSLAISARYVIAMPIINAVRPWTYYLIVHF